MIDGYIDVFVFELVCLVTEVQNPPIPTDLEYKAFAAALVYDFSGQYTQVPDCGYSIKAEEF